MKRALAPIAAVTLLTPNLIACTEVSTKTERPAIEWSAPQNTTEINLDEMARRPISSEAARWIGSVVHVDVTNGYLTGQKVAPERVITAGHAFRGRAPLESCGITVTDQGTESEPGIKYTSTGAGGSHYDHDLVSIDMGKEQLPGPYVPLADIEKVDRGDEVLLVGYKPNIEGELRDPSSNDPTLRAPGVVRSIMLGVEGSRAVVLTGTKVGPEDKTRAGISGGPGLVPGGTIGVISQEDFLVPAAAIEEAYNVDIVGTSVPEDFQLVQLEIATAGSISRAASQPMVAGTDC